MAKKFLFLSVIFGMHQLCALPLGNPADPTLYQRGLCSEMGREWGNWKDDISWRLGYYADYVYNRHLEEKESHADFDFSKLDTNAGVVILNYCDRLDLFAIFGVTNFSLEAPRPQTGFIGTFITEIVCDPRYSWGVGARGLLFECGCIKIGAEGQYFYTHPDVSYVRVSSFPIFPGKVDVKYREWQVGAGLALDLLFQFGCVPVHVLPYAGVKGGRASAAFSTDSVVIVNLAPNRIINLPDLQSEQSLGYAIGFSIVVNETIGGTVEGRFADEKALYVTGQIAF